LAPSRAVCLGILYRKWKAAVGGLTKQALGLLVVGSTTAFLVTIFFKHVTPAIFITPEVMARTLPTLKEIYLAIFIAVSSGVAASLMLVADPRVVSQPLQQLIDVMIGAEIAISLIPPASVVGIGLAFARFDISLHSLGLLAINLLSLDVIGSVPVLYLWGIGSKPLQLENKIREITERVAKEAVKVDKISVDVTLQNYTRSDVDVRVHAVEFNKEAYTFLVKKISERIKRETGAAGNVRIKISPAIVYAP